MQCLLRKVAGTNQSDHVAAVRRAPRRRAVLWQPVAIDRADDDEGELAVRPLDRAEHVGNLSLAAIERSFKDRHAPRLRGNIVAEGRLVAGKRHDIAQRKIDGAWRGIYHAPVVCPFGDAKARQLIGAGGRLEGTSICLRDPRRPLQRLEIGMAAENRLDKGPNLL